MVNISNLKSYSHLSPLLVLDSLSLHFLEYRTSGSALLLVPPQIPLPLYPQASMDGAKAIL